MRRGGGAARTHRGLLGLDWRLGMAVATADEMEEGNNRKNDGESRIDPSEDRDGLGRMRAQSPPHVPAYRFPRRLYHRREVTSASAEVARQQLCASEIQGRGPRCSSHRSFLQVCRHAAQNVSGVARLSDGHVGELGRSNALLPVTAIFAPNQPASDIEHCQDELR